MSDWQEEWRRRDRSRRDEVKGASALAVAGSRVALFGGYGPDYDQLGIGDIPA